MPAVCLFFPPLTEAYKFYRAYFYFSKKKRPLEEDAKNRDPRRRNDGNECHKL